MFIIINVKNRSAASYFCENLFFFSGSFDEYKVQLTAFIWNNKSFVTLKTPFLSLLNILMCACWIKVYISLKKNYIPQTFER